MEDSMRINAVKRYKRIVKSKKVQNKSLYSPKILTKPDVEPSDRKSVINSQRIVRQIKRLIPPEA